MMVRVSPMTAASFAEALARSRLGMAMAAMIPMMATTISSSISVNPFSRISSLLCVTTRRRVDTKRGSDGRSPGTDRDLLERRAGGGHRCRRAAVGGGGVGHADHAAVVAAKRAHARLVGDRRLGAVAEDVDRTSRRAVGGGDSRELPRVALLRGETRDGAVQAGRSQVRVVRHAGRVRRNRQTRDGAVEARVRGLIRRLTGDDRAGVADRAGLVGGHARAEETGDRDRGDNPDDRHDDQQLDKGETLLILQFNLSLVCDIAALTIASRVPESYRRKQLIQLEMYKIER